MRGSQRPLLEMIIHPTIVDKLKRRPTDFQHYLPYLVVALAFLGTSS